MKTVVLWSVGVVGFGVAAIIGIREWMIRDLVSAMRDMTRTEGQQAFMQLCTDAGALRARTGHWPQNISDLLDRSILPRPAAMARVFSLEHDGARTVMVWSLESQELRLPLRTYQEMLDDPYRSASEPTNPFADPSLTKPPPAGTASQ